MDVKEQLQVIENHIHSADGTKITYKITGSGPGLLIISGADRGAKHYVKLAAGLKDDFTMYIINRRGRGGSGPQGPDYSVAKECEDAMAIIQKHNIPYIFGHSFGGIVGLNIALKEDIKKLVVYEPGMSPNNNLPLAWVPKFEKQLYKKAYTGALVSIAKGLGMMGPLTKVPSFLLHGVFGFMAMGNKDWQEDKMLLELVPNEIRAGVAMDADIARYKDIQCPVLLMGGTASPLWLLQALRKLHGIIPGSVLTELTGLVHNAPDEFAPEKVGEEIRKFLGSDGILTE